MSLRAKNIGGQDKRTSLKQSLCRVAGAARTLAYKSFHTFANSTSHHPVDAELPLVPHETAEIRNRASVMDKLHTNIAILYTSKLCGRLFVYILWTRSPDLDIS